MSLDTIIEAYEKKYAKEGERLVFGGDEYDDPPRIWPGSLELAYAMGGGFPSGRWGRLWGPKSSGKTKTAYSIAAAAQKEYGMTVAYIDAEKQYYPGFAHMQGVDTSKENFKVVYGNVIEQVGEAVEALLPYIDLFIIDSTSALKSAAAKESGIDSERPMMEAKAWTNVTGFWLDAFDPKHNTIIFIDQARVGKGWNGMPAGQQASGGYALDHYSTLTAKFTEGKHLYLKEGWLDDTEASKAAAPEGPTGSKEPAGKEMTVRIEKSRVGAPFRTAKLWFDFRTGDYEAEHEYLKWANYFDMFNKSGSWYEVDGKKIQGAHKVKQYIRDNPDLQQEIKDKVLDYA